MLAVPATCAVADGADRVSSRRAQTKSRARRQNGSTLWQRIGSSSSGRGEVETESFDMGGLHLASLYFHTVIGIPARTAAGKSGWCDSLMLAPRRSNQYRAQDLVLNSHDIVLVFSSHL